MTTDDKDADRLEPRKRPYEKPRLDVYGDIRELTDSVDMTGQEDNAIHGSSRTKTG